MVAADLPGHELLAVLQVNGEVAGVGDVLRRHGQELCFRIPVQTTQGGVYLEPVTIE